MKNFKDELDVSGWMLIFVMIVAFFVIAIMLLGSVAIILGLLKLISWLA